MTNGTRRGIAVITGSSTGIGHATALRLARDGYHVIATMRRPDGSDLVDLAAAEGLALETAALDVTEEQSVEGLFGAVFERHGHVDVLVANAGVGGGGGALEMASLDDFRTAMETNFFGALRCIKAVVPSMRARESGTIVAMSSQAGRLAPPTMPAYVASKWALEGAMESFAGSVAPFGIRVAIIEPGTIVTPIFSKGDVGPPSPYQASTDVFLHQLMHDLERGSEPALVADCVANAITTGDPQLRYLVGQGAERNLRVRTSMTDQEYVEVHRLAVEEQIRVLLDGET